MKEVRSYRSWDRSTIQILEDGRSVRTSILGRMLLDESMNFVRFLSDDEVVS